MADHPLRPATDPRLGRPFPHQLANRTQAPPQAPEGFSDEALPPPPHRVLAPISQSYPLLRGRSLMRYSPICHYLPLAGKIVRLACIKHAASVYPEPGSNSPSKMIDCSLNLSLAIQLLRCSMPLKDNITGQPCQYQLAASSP